MNNSPIMLRCWISIILALFICSFLGCSQKIDNSVLKDTKESLKVAQEEVKINPDKIDDWHFEDNNIGSPIISEEGKKIDPNRKLVEWKAKSFEGRGQLKRKWDIDIDKEEEYGISYVFAYPNRWDIGDWYSINPLVGKQPSKEIIIPPNEEYMYGCTLSGPTDGEYVFGCKWHVGLSTYCWRLGDGKNMWIGEQLAFETSDFVIIDNKLFHVDSNRIIKVKPWTGEQIWSIFSKSQIKYFLSGYYEQNSCGIANTSNKLFVLMENGHLYDIDVDTGEQELVKYTQQNPIAITASGDDLLVLTSDGSISELNAQTLEESKHFETGYKLKKSTNEMPVYYSIQSIGSKIIIADNGWPQSSSFLYDTKSKTGIKYDKQDTFVINSSLVFEDDKQIKGVDPETLETLWWIDRKDITGSNAHVAWCDWRGVCVISDDAISCYAPPK